MDKVILKTEMPDIGVPRSGKVRDIYDLGEHLLLVATDRVSAFDVILPNGIPGKGKILTAISNFWFKMMKEEIIWNHIIATEVADFPPALHKYTEVLKGRSVLVKKMEVLPVECIVRGYLSGSGWKSYQRNGTVCGIKLPDGLRESDKLPEPIFTPSTKAEKGHDVNISFDETVKIIGLNLAFSVRQKSLEIYKRACQHAETRGIIIADTKFEFWALQSGPVTVLMLIDELLTPDSSRFWSTKDYAPGRTQDSFDKQIVRNYLLTLDWDQTPPGPELPPDIVKKTADRYQEILQILTG